MISALLVPNNSISLDSIGAKEERGGELEGERERGRRERERGGEGGGEGREGLNSYTSSSGGFPPLEVQGTQTRTLSLFFGVKEKEG